MKRYRVDGELVEYPEGIDYHHIYGQHKGPGVYICHLCHQAHHFSRAISIIETPEGIVARRPWTHEDYQRLVTAKEWDH